MLLQTTSTFVIAGKEFDPDLLTQLIGVKPSKVWTIHPMVAAQAPNIPKIEWQFTITTCQCDLLNDAIVAVLTPFKPQKDKITEFVQQNNCEAIVTIRLKGNMNKIILCVNSDAIKLLLDFNAKICISTAPID